MLLLINAVVNAVEQSRVEIRESRERESRKRMKERVRVVAAAAVVDLFVVDCPATLSLSHSLSPACHLPQSFKIWSS